MANRDYKKGRIYCVRNDINDDVYVGSTIQPLSKRMATHRDKCKTQPFTLYVCMREIGVDHFYIELLEEYPCDNLEQLRRREGECIRSIGTLNMQISGRTQKEWYTDNTAKVKEYRENRKEQLKTYNKEYKDNNADDL